MLVHYSDKPVLSVHDATFKRDEHYGAGKPPGFWISVDDAWKRFCEYEFDSRLTYCAVAHEVTLREDANVLRIASARELEEFTERFRQKQEKPFSRFDYIDWEPVMEQHDGIIIAPYLWSCRLKFMWYYGWDVASGVIWRARAVQHIRVINESEIPSDETEREGGMMDNFAMNIK